MITWLLWWKRFRSEKNGLITCRRLLGRWEVFVGGFHESSRYLESIWRDAYGRLPAGFQPRRVLMLGLAAGDNVRLLHGLWPEARVTAVEWDPVMVQVAEKLKLYPDEWRPEIIIADAAMALTSEPGVTNGRFDLILVDIFEGGRVGRSAFGTGFFRHVSDRLSSSGQVIVNAFLQPEELDLAATELLESSRWKFKHNRMGLFSGADK